MHRLVLVVCFFAAVAASRGPHCRYGPGYIDECDNDCTCDGLGYECTRKACGPWENSEQPLRCRDAEGLPQRPGMRVFCHQGIVKFQELYASCLPGALFKDEEGCNDCICGDFGEPGCTFKLCPEKVGCPYGRAFIDLCDNDCECVNNEFYGCTRKACKSGQISQEPKLCDGAENLPERYGKRVVCHNGIVKVQNYNEPCLPNSVYKDECNTCTCGGGCTLKACR